MKPPPLLTRLGVAALSWALCVPAFVLSVSMAVGAGADALGYFAAEAGAEAPGSPLGLPGVMLMPMVGVAVPYAWLALLVMTVGWLRQRRLHRWWPRTGTVAALFGLLFFSVMLGPGGLAMSVVYAAPGMAFAAFLCRFHLDTPQTPGDAGPLPQPEQGR